MKTNFLLFYNKNKKNYELGIIFNLLNYKSY